MIVLPKVAVAMSGGVDSSVAAALLVAEGYPVIGIMLRLWSEPGAENENRCCTPDAMAQARRVAAQLGIQFYAIDARQRFHDTVVQTFLSGYVQGLTPNPCVVCNRLIRWGLLLDTALAMGAEKMATGHYARLRTLEDGTVQLLKGIDPRKDQSYILSSLSQDQLNHALLPLGEYQKSQVRELARNFGLPVAERSESQDLCFLAGQDYRQFLGRHAPEALKPGPIVDRRGSILGEHRGLAFYTVGQRKGIGIAFPEPLYVLNKDMHTNTLVVGPVSELGQDTLQAHHVNWTSGSVPQGPFPADVKIRYKAELARATIFPLEGDQARLVFEHPMRDITPGQLVVFYNNEMVVGGGLIAR
ncbi:MAG TPA: tRNA 2-thiouridine(34) synthase MnmA [Anaerolineaceae bacterium]|nr:tRNA 2-thiouridine(34) synthase MnmA [Anaerolineaceae bacterium]